MKQKQKIKKGDLVRLNAAKCFSVKNGGELAWPMFSSHNDDAGIVCGIREITQAELDEWYASPDSKGIGDDGETKLPPKSITVKLHRDDLFMVRRARCKADFGWYNYPKQIELFDYKSGYFCFVDRILVELVQ